MRGSDEARHSPGILLFGSVYQPIDCYPRGRMRAVIVTMFMGWLVLGCGDAGTGPVKVHWDRDGCERCGMMLSDRYHAVQLRYLDVQQRSRVRLFDDFGCAMIWLEDKPWRDHPTTEIWVTDHATGEWIDARRAYYIEGEVTPMEYGLGAQRLPTIKEGLNFAEATQHIFEREQRYNQHGTHLQDRGADQ